MGYPAKLFANAEVSTYIHRHIPEIFEQFEILGNTVTLAEALGQQQNEDATQPVDVARSIADDATRIGVGDDARM